MERLHYYIRVVGFNSSWVSDMRLLPQGEISKVISKELKEGFDEEVSFDIDEVELTVLFPKSNFTKEQIEDTFLDNNGYIQDEYNYEGVDVYAVDYNLTK